jgi:SPP1 gp7 family putative phage head morphogenesis protein
MVSCTHKSLDASPNIRPETKTERRTWAHVRRAEIAYGRDLRAVARQVAWLIRGMSGEPPDALILALELYGESLGPWAWASAGRMLADVSRRDEAMWNTLSRSMSRALREELQTFPTGELYRGLQQAQVGLIKSLPLEAAKKVHAITEEARVATGERAAQLSARINALGDITESRAMLIARTETARTASNIVQARAQYVGSEGYIWRSSGDVDVRPVHQKLNGTYHKWSEPPIADVRPIRAHPGCIFNCRCFAEPIISDFRHYDRFI